MSKAKKAPAKKKTNGYKMPEPLPAGEVLQDIYKKQWVLGPSIGKGGFGEIYSAKKGANQADGDKHYNYVIKIEPHDNGPLFVEMNFYIRCAREADVTQFQKSKKLKHLGMPVYIGSGSHTYNNEKYRFILMEKFAPKDIWKLYVENDKQLPAITVYRLALQMLDSLEYIHSRGYIHGDLKGANILLSSKNKDNAYLVDFGLAGKFTTDVDFVPNPKRMHNGTIEYSSRDAHQGVQTRRGDIEILAYNIIHWLTGVLPWEGLTDPKAAHKSKEESMKDIKTFLSSCFGDIPSDPITEFLIYINTLKHDQEPDYAKIRKILLKGLQNAGGTENSPLEFSTLKRKPTSQENGASPKKRSKATAKTAVARKDKGSKDELSMDVEAPKSNMNGEELRIAELKTATPKKGRKKPAAAIAVLTATDIDERGKGDGPVSSMNSEELRITALKAKTPKKGRRKAAPASASASASDSALAADPKEEDTENMSPPSNMAVVPPRGVRSSPRVRQRVNYTDL